MGEGISPHLIRSNLSEMKITQEHWDNMFKPKEKNEIEKCKKRNKETKETKNQILTKE